MHSHGGEADRNIAVGVHWQMFVGNQEFPLRCGTCLFFVPMAFGSSARICLVLARCRFFA